jgi:hypothetical protein
VSDIFELDTAGQHSLAGEASANLLQPDQNPSGFFHGVPQAIGMGVMRGGVRAAQAVGMAGGGLLSQLEQDGEGAPGLKPGTLTDPYFHALDEFVSSAVDYWTPGANEVGTAGRILGGFSEMALPLMAGGGNPSLLIGSAAMGTGHDLVQQGVDAKTATGVAVTQAAATAIGFRIPFLGSTLVSRIASGAAGNVAVNAGSAEISHAILQAAGYDEQAKNFDPLDLEARIVDLLSGAVFGTVAHLGTPSLRDAAATAANAKHFQFDTAPGDPADIGSSIAHQKAMEAAVRDTLAGEPVDLSRTGIDQADFVPRERPPAFTEMPEELRGVDEALKEQPAGNPERVDVLPQEAKPTGFEVGQVWEKPGQEPYRIVEVSSDGRRAKADYGEGPPVWVHYNTEVDNGWASKRAPAEVVPQDASSPDIAKTAGQTVVDPVVSSARAAVAEKDFPIPTGEIDQDGRVITRSAREMLDQADQDVTKAQNDSKAFDALASCILSRGNG